LALLHEHVAMVRTGAGQVLSVLGPPGIGKSRLLTELRRQLASEQVTWYAGQCLPYGQTTPYLPVRDMVQQVCGLTAQDPLEVRTAAVRRALARLGGGTEEDVALLLQVLDLPVAPETLLRLSPEARQARTFTLLGHLLRQAAQQRPLVLVVEDVQWIDPTSAAWLTALVDRLALRRVPRWLPDWSLYREPELVTVSPRHVRKAILDAMWFLWAFGLWEFVEELHKLHLLPTFF
jgi:predicted ATPase